MILSGLEIQRRLDKDIIIERLDEKILNPNSVQGDYKKYNPGKYQNASEIQPSRLYMELEENECP